MSQFNFKDNEIIYKREDKVPYEDSTIKVAGAVWKKPIMEHLSVEITAQIYITDDKGMMWGKSLSCPFNQEELDKEMDYIKEHLIDYKNK